jgi:LysR family hydrogen peroxide-inducible transcriptional activator
MNLQQLEYIIAVDTHRHFARAADSCFVTQATLSMMIKRLEQELGASIFDRSRQPVVPTEVGAKVIAQAKRVLQESRRLKEVVESEHGELKGELRLGIIPTLAPYLLPLFMQAFLGKHPKVQLKISELTTGEIIRRLRQDALDAGLLATPLNHPDIAEQPLFYEDFVVFVPPGEAQEQDREWTPDDLDISRLWLLEEGHCLRSQVVNLCGLKDREKASHQLDFSTGSLETLKKLVALNKGMTIMPSLAVREMGAQERSQVRHFQQPAPAREIGLVSYRYLVKEHLIRALADCISVHLLAGNGIQHAPEYVYQSRVG